MGKAYVIECENCGRDLTPVIPRLIVYVIRTIQGLLPIGVELRKVAQCKRCSETYDTEAKTEEIEEIPSDEWLALRTTGIEESFVDMTEEVKKQQQAQQGQEDEESPSRRKIGFCSEEEDE